jgi:hypothetical protein
MANTVIQLKKSAVPTAQPNAGSLANGELAINYADGKLFYKDSSGLIQQISSGGNTFSTINAAGTLLVSDLPGDILTIDQGDNIIIVPEPLNDKLTISANLSPANNYAGAMANSVNAYTSTTYSTLTQFGSVFGVANAAFDKANTGSTNVNTFSSIAVAGQGTILASLEDTLNLSDGNGINIQTDPVTKTVSFGIVPGTYSGDYGLITEPVNMIHDYGGLG